jgi:hypothetical protein
MADVEPGLGGLKQRRTRVRADYEGVAAKRGNGLVGEGGTSGMAGGEYEAGWWCLRRRRRGCTVGGSEWSG